MKTNRHENDSSDMDNLEMSDGNKNIVKIQKVGRREFRISGESQIYDTAQPIMTEEDNPKAGFLIYARGQGLSTTKFVLNDTEVELVEIISPVDAMINGTDLQGNSIGVIDTVIGVGSKYTAEQARAEIMSMNKQGRIEQIHNEIHRLKTVGINADQDEDEKGIMALYDAVAEKRMIEELEKELNDLTTESESVIENLYQGAENKPVDSSMYSSLEEIKYDLSELGRNPDTLVIEIMRIEVKLMRTIDTGMYITNGKNWEADGTRE